ncbi:MAG: RIP metalloprotease RseP [Clostridiales bacterium]|nr:RIP metalloprotease RseP [Clostridiales bacterium]
MTIVYALIIFAILILVHELGHFITAKMFGVKVNEFALGMGPALYKKQGGETVFSVRAIPIGGFCSMEGENEDSEDERAFNKKPAGKRAVILAAGSFMNLMLAIIIFSLILFSLGYAQTTLSEVKAGSPAEKAGLLEGDKIVSVDGTTIKKWEDVVGIVSSKEPGDEVVLGIKRNNEALTLTASTYDQEGRTVMGVTAKVVKNPARALLDGTKATFALATSMVDILKQLLTGDIAATELTGPVGIVYLVGDSAKMGLNYVMYLTALISLNLAIINLLPFPALDGGRLLFIVIRKVTGRAITDDIEAKVHILGLMLLMALMVYVTWQDIIRFILPGGQGL